MLTDVQTPFLGTPLVPLKQAVKYGLGKVQCNVRQDGDRFEIENVQRLTTRLRFAVDGGLQGEPTV